MKLTQLLELLTKTVGALKSRADSVDVVVEIHQPGSVGGTPTINIVQGSMGFDWDANKFILGTEKALSVLTEEERKAIEESVSKGQSWHAYQDHKKLQGQLKTLREENAIMRKTLKLSEDALLYINQTGLLTGEAGVNKLAIKGMVDACQAIQALELD